MKIFFLFLLLLCFSPVQADVLFADGLINGKPVTFLVDTGADEISIPYRQAIQLGIPVFSGQRAESMTASGKVGIYKLKLKTVTLGRVTLRDVDAHISLQESGEQTILLGMSFLGRVTAVFDHGILKIWP